MERAEKMHITLVKERINICEIDVLKKQR